MKITIVGTGYVGLVTGTCFAEVGIETECVDNNSSKVKGLQNGIMPIFEPGLEEMVLRNYKKGRLNFTTSLTNSIKDSKVIFIAVGTPPSEDGSADLKHVEAVAREIGANLEEYSVMLLKAQFQSVHQKL